MPKNDYSKRREIKELIKSEIKGNISEFGPLSTVQGIVRGLAGMVYDKKRNIKNAEIDMKVRKVKKQQSAAYNKIIKHAKKLAKEYGTWEEVPFFIRNKYEKAVPEFAKLMNEV